MAITRNPFSRALIVVGMLLVASALSGCGGYSSLDTPGAEPDEEQSTQDYGQEAVRVAEEFIGTPYRSGGTTASGVDCSGLTFTVFRRIGVRLPRTSDEQARAGSHIDRDQLRAGDLVFFGRGSNITHVGIYADDGEFIHASTRARSVRYDSLDTKYFHNRYIGARRVL